MEAEDIIMTLQHLPGHKSYSSHYPCLVLPYSLPRHQ